MMVNTGVWVLVYYENNIDEYYSSLEKARAAAEKYVGNSRYAKPFAREEKYLYGPGDGTTSIMIFQHRIPVKE